MAQDPTELLLEELRDLNERHGGDVFRRTWFTGEDQIQVSHVDATWVGVVLAIGRTYDHDPIGFTSDLSFRLQRADESRFEH